MNKQTKKHDSDASEMEEGKTDVEGDDSKRQQHQKQRGKTTTHVKYTHIEYSSKEGIIFSLVVGLYLLMIPVCVLTIISYIDNGNVASNVESIMLQGGYVHLLKLQVKTEQQDSKQVVCGNNCIVMEDECGACQFDSDCPDAKRLSITNYDEGYSKTCELNRCMYSIYIDSDKKSKKMDVDDIRHFSCDVIKSGSLVPQGNTTDCSFSIYLMSESIPNMRCAIIY